MKPTPFFWAVVTLFVFFACLGFWLKSACGEESIDWDRLVEAVIQCESGGNPSAYNKSSKAVGLMQITPVVLKEWNNEHSYEYGAKRGWKEIGETYFREDLFNTVVSVKIGTWYLHRLHDHYLKNLRFDYYDSTGTYGYRQFGKAICIRTGEYGGDPIFEIKNFKHINSPIDYKISLVLAAYNGGITKLKNNGYDINKMPQETKTYIKRVLKIYKEDK